MAEEIVQYEDRDGAAITLTPTDVAMYCASGGAQLTQRDVVNFMATCKALGANPYLGDVYLVKYNSAENAQIMAGKNYYTRVAVSIPTYDGMTAGIVCVTQTGEIVYHAGSLLLPGETCIGGWAEVHDKRWGTPVRAEVALSEYNTNKSLWKSKPLTMIRKVALVQALREAYPDRFAGTYDASEMGEKGAVPAPQEVRAEAQQPQQQAAPQQQAQQQVPADAIEAQVRRLAALGYDADQTRAWLTDQWRQGGWPQCQQAADAMAQQVAQAQPQNAEPEYEVEV